MTAALYIAVVKGDWSEVKRLIAEGGHLSDNERKRLLRDFKKAREAA